MRYVIPHNYFIERDEYARVKNLGTSSFFVWDTEEHTMTLTTISEIKGNRIRFANAIRGRVAPVRGDALVLSGIKSNIETTNFVFGLLPNSVIFYVNGMLVMYSGRYKEVIPIYARDDNHFLIVDGRAIYKMGFYLPNGLSSLSEVVRHIALID